MMRNIPKAFQKYMGKVIQEIDEAWDCEAKYDVILLKGWSFNTDHHQNGLNGTMCSGWHTWMNVREGLDELKGVHRCDCAACMKAHEGKCHQ